MTDRSGSSNRWGGAFLQTTIDHAADTVVTGGIEPMSWTLGRHRWSLLDNGVLTIEPLEGAASVHTSLVLSAAIHGNETAPAEMLDRIVHDLATASLVPGVRLLAILGNPQAIVAGTRFVEENLNRLFSGVHEQRNHAEARRAALLEHAVGEFFAAAPPQHRRLHYELHTAIRASQLERFAVFPFGQPVDDEQLDFLRRADIHGILLDNGPSTTFSYFSSNRWGAESMTLELGRVSPLGANDPSRLAAIDACLRAVVRDGWPSPSLPPIVSDPQVFEVEHELLRTHASDFLLHVADDAPNFSLIEPGHRITSDPDGGIIIDGPGRRIVFPNPQVPVGQRVGLVIAPR
ncbi:MAG: succinylglutamate desuccinylase [Acidimicrobiales bacterium]